jgi:hypothetical protein
MSHESTQLFRRWLLFDDSLIPIYSLLCGDEFNLRSRSSFSNMMISTSLQWTSVASERNQTNSADAVNMEFFLVFIPTFTEDNCPVSIPTDEKESKASFELVFLKRPVKGKRADSTFLWIGLQLPFIKKMF